MPAIGFYSNSISVFVMLYNVNNNKVSSFKEAV